MAHIFPMTHDHPRWAETIALAEGCSWRAGPVLASLMRDAQFLSWERVFCAVGCAHLPGDKGLIGLLRKKGYTVEPVKFEWNTDR